ncbi:DegT/DnrJ/EryC1/StrS family aminotransferase [uncultured Hyphomicrobium sp.]|uniref:DegT/DnrJ/EryC1/StrS family aminotransferase n=1 Tax=uncultured Hyphomicrobium sp. TaxID=194373 RepID=UPI0025F2AD89|nr:DegT/DnrJ/EryC1/StrS family aminotransferase [uncultured Hyphomicrobium sp.]
MQFIDLKVQQAAIKPDLDRRIAAVLAHGQYIMGPEVAELEAALAAYVGARHCVTVASGTEALLIALMALGVGPGDEIITTPFTFVATVEVIALLGATPVFVDIEPATTNIDPALIEARITPRTKAIIPVSLYGQVADIEAINAVAARHGNIPVIEDGAQSFGATADGRQSCGLSTFGCTSFFPSKPLGCYGDGGALFTNDDDLARACREIRVHGQSKRYVHTRIGVGGRMDTLQCAIVLAKLTRFPWEATQRSAIGGRYTTLIHERVPGAKPVETRDVGQPLSGVRTLILRPERTSVYAQYTVLVPQRENVQAKLQAAGIPTAVHYPVPLNQQPAYKDLAPGDATPISAWAAEHVMSLPMGPDLSESDQDRVVAALATAVA